ncbi:3,4-dihydroxy-2-butanone-4-phosphate synthase [Halomicrobium urmianum]|uniref:3,4-dihydroxy-2-butanone-4-phosphate synthase n=1 Tax=Halomicrobium urmianum TaxID=1586233 RepID=UPI001CD94124|nr:3,4-dihydroxy-2-butanone-4-phosphate synthase [Halomicrobium urmianum]
MSRSSDRAAGAVEDAVAAFGRGRPVLVHDAADREGETDLIYPADAVEPADVARMRNDAGGLVCVALPDEVAATYDLPFVRGELDHPAADGHDVDYDERSSFSITVNHRDTFTGITDEDRSQTITALADAAADGRDAAGDEGPGADDFAASFRSPGHVHLLRAAPGGLADRRGHTELGLALADAADRPPAVVVCEMLDDESGEALSPGAAKAYADREGLAYVEGAALVERFE